MLYRDINFRNADIRSAHAEKAPHPAISPPPPPPKSLCEAGNLDVMTVKKTKLDWQIGDNEIQIDGYDIIRKHRNKFGGGVCSYIKNQFNYTVRNDLMPGQRENIIIEIKQLIQFQFLYALCMQVHQLICSKSLSRLLKKLMQ